MQRAKRTAKSNVRGSARAAKVNVRLAVQARPNNQCGPATENGINRERVKQWGGVGWWVAHGRKWHHVNNQQTQACVPGITPNK